MSLQGPAETLIGLSFVLVLCGAPTPASSQTAPPPAEGALSDAGRTSAARAAHVRGLEARQKGDFAAAYEALLEAWQYKHHWEIAVNLGEAEMKLGKWEDAITHLSFAVAEPGFLARSVILVETERDQINTWLAEARSKLDTRTAVSATATGGAESAPTGPLSATWVLGIAAGAGATAASVIAGALLHGMAASKLDTVQRSLEKLPGEPGDPASIRCAGEAASVCTSNEQRLRDADGLQNAGSAALVLAGMFATGTIVYAALWPRREKGRPVIVPTAGDRAGGLLIAGAF